MNANPTLMNYTLKKPWYRLLCLGILLNCVLLDLGAQESRSNFLTTVFSEDFESVNLGSSVDEVVQRDDVWSKSGPDGWTHDDSGVPGAGDPDQDGITEWAGWSFASKDWWIETAGDQGRVNFTAGTGTVAIADGDEWDDANSRAPGNQTTYLMTPEIDLGAAVPGSLRIDFDSSYAADGDQESGTVDVSYDGGQTWNQILLWTKANTPNEKNYESVSLRASNPYGADKAMFRFGYINAGNNWWFAIDNIEVQVVRPSLLFSEDFEGVELGASVDEGVQGDNVWSKSGPEGWTHDDSGVPGVGDPDQDGITEWAGWSFASKDWWVETAGDQGRVNFTAGTGTVAIADGDEWDDANSRAPGNQTTYLMTPDIDIAGILPGSLQIAFDSSYAADGDQESGTVDVSYDGGQSWSEILLWTKANTPNEKNYESVSLRVNNPSGAERAMFRFGYINAGNNWWFAIDNIQAFGSFPFWMEDFEGVELGASVDEGVQGDNVWSKSGPEGWTHDDSGVPGVGDPNQDGITEWAGWSFASKDWWVETAGDQGRVNFTAGMGTVAIADGDEWDDADSRAPGNQTTFLISPDIDISGIGTAAIVLTADTSYAADGDQESANVEISFDEGQTWSEILLWTKANTPNEKNYESISLKSTVPPGASKVRYKFGYINAGNNWWFALDNLALFGLDSVPPSLKSTSPRDGQNQVSPQATITFVIDPGTTGVASAKLVNMTSGAELVTTSESDEDGNIVITHIPSTSFAFGEEVTLQLIITDENGDESLEALTFQVDDPFQMGPEFRLNIDKDDRGFILLTKVNSNYTQNTHQRAEDQLANRILENGEPITNDSDDSNADGSFDENNEFYLIENDVINYNQDSTEDNSQSIGEVGGDGPIPGVPFGLNNGIAMEFYTYLELEAGYYLMGFNSDDGFKITVGPEFRSISAPIVGEFEGGRGAATTLFSILVSEPGLYPFRGIWYEGGGGANLEWWHVGPDGERILINDSSNPNAIKAYRPASAQNPVPIISQNFPGSGSSNVSADGTISIRIADGALQPVDRSSIKLTVGGHGLVTPSVMVDPDDENFLIISWSPESIFTPGEMVGVNLEYSYGSGDNKVTRTFGYEFKVSDYPTVSVASSNPQEIGFNYSFHQIASENFNEPIVLQNNIGRAEAQLAGMLPHPNLAWTELEDGASEMEAIILPDLENPTSTTTEGFFEGFDEIVEIPGFAFLSLVDIPYVAVELSGFVELPQGYSRFGINIAGGARITIGGNPTSGNNPAAALDAFEWINVPASSEYSETQFDVLAEETGVYPIRIVYYQGGQEAGSFGLELYSISPSGERILINDPDNDQAINVYRTADADYGPFVEAMAPTPIDPAYISDDIIGILLNPGTSGDIATGNINLTLNGNPVPSSRTDFDNLGDGRVLVTIDVEGFVIPESWHGIIVEYGEGDVRKTDRWAFKGVRAGDADSLSPIFFEDFDSAVLGPNVDESVEEEEAWTRDFDGWPVDSSGVPGFDSPDEDGDGFGDLDGMSEWAGWSFAKIGFWQSVDGQRRAEFTNASGVVLVADPDEWDDDPHADSAANGWYNTLVESPEISIDGNKSIPGGLFLEFDSSWRPECDSNYRQSARVWVQYDGQERKQVLLWTSCPGPNFKDDNSTNDHILLPLDNPEGATKVKVIFEMFDAGNDWWWAIDNVALKSTTDSAILRSECDALTLAGLTCDTGGETGSVGNVAIASDGANITLAWPDASDATFQVQRRSSLSPDAQWENVGDPTSQKSFTDPIGDDKAFYRIVIVANP